MTCNVLSGTLSLYTRPTSAVILLPQIGQLLNLSATLGLHIQELDALSWYKNTTSLKSVRVVSRNISEKCEVTILLPWLRLLAHAVST